MNLKKIPENWHKRNRKIFTFLGKSFASLKENSQYSLKTFIVSYFQENPCFWAILYLKGQSLSRMKILSGLPFLDILFLRSLSAPRIQTLIWDVGSHFLKSPQRHTESNKTNKVELIGFYLKRPNLESTVH